jgi:U4/U6.U5 tri-snRNP-associated protein 2
LLLDVDAAPSNSSTLYDLIANVTHESVAGTTRDKENTVWKALLRAAGGGGESERWFMIQDLIVEDTRKEMIFLGETVLQVRMLTVCKNCTR